MCVERERERSDKIQMMTSRVVCRFFVSNFFCCFVVVVAAASALKTVDDVTGGTAWFGSQLISVDRARGHVYFQSQVMHQRQGRRLVVIGLFDVCLSDLRLLTDTSAEVVG